MLSDDEIRRVFLAHGFTIKDGHADLKPYVYEAARALLAAAIPEGMVLVPREGAKGLLDGERGFF